MKTYFQATREPTTGTRAACAFYLFIRQLMGVGSQLCGAKYPGFCADSKGV